MINQINDNLPVFGAGAGFGLFVFYMVKLAGPHVWDMIKKTGYSLWDDIKGLVTKTPV